MKIHPNIVLVIYMQTLKKFREFLSVEERHTL